MCPQKETKPARWDTQRQADLLRVPGQPEAHSETLSQSNKITRQAGFAGTLPIILATSKAEAGGSQISGQPEENSSTPI